MRRHLGPALSLCVFASLAACSGQDDEGSDTAGVQRDKVVLVVMGGNTSCGQDAAGQPSPFGTTLYGPFRQVADDLARSGGEEPRWLVSCHTAASTFYYATSESPDQIQSAALEQATGIVDGLTGDDGRLFVAGHSYGGWLALQVALGARQPVEALTSIDPISRATCSFTSPFGCMSFPSDVTAAQRAELKRKTGRWVNFYQTQTWYLHSGAAAEADANVQLAVPHVGIETDGNVWGEIGEQVKGALALAGR